MSSSDGEGYFSRSIAVVVSNVAIFLSLLASFSTDFGSDPS